MLRAKRLSAFAMAAILIVACLMVLHKVPPSHSGHSLIYWLEQDNVRDIDRRMEAQREVKAIGTKGIPTLLGLIQSKDSWARIQWAKVASHFSFLPVIPYRVEQDRMLALNGFRILKEQAASAVPELVKLLDYPVYAKIAMTALKDVELNQTTFIHALRHPNPDVRSEAAIELGYRKYNNSGEVDALIQTLNDPNPKVRYAAAYALVRFPSEAEKIVPAFIQILKNENEREQTISQIIQGLGNFGARAKSAVPYLRPRPGMLVETALRRIQQDTLPEQAAIPQPANKPEKP